MSDAATPPIPYDAPGCGAGLYALLLFGIGSLGLFGMIGATIGLLNSQPEEARSLVHGSEVQVWRLQPMRKLGLLELGEIPAAWHDESPGYDGTRACVIRSHSVGRVEDEQATEIPWTEVSATAVERTSEDVMSITVSGKDTTITCHFGPNEGAERFLRQVETERKRNAD
jgi:hypothetical protein